MSKDELFIYQIKADLLKNLKEINLTKKDRNFLLELIKLFDALAKTPEEKFINSIIGLIENSKLEEKTELNTRLISLNEQLENSKYKEIRHLSYFSMYFQEEKINIYIKKISPNWELLISEIEKINFEKLRVIIYKSSTKKEKILNKLLSKKENWKEEIINIIEDNICINIQITLDLKKKTLI